MPFNAGGGEGDGVLAFLKGLLGGGEPEMGGPPTEDIVGGVGGGAYGTDVIPAAEAQAAVGGVDTGTAEPVLGGDAPPQSDAPSLIEELMNRNKEFAPYRDTGIR